MDLPSTEESPHLTFKNALHNLGADNDVSQMAAWLRHHLLGHVMPFWEKYAFDTDGSLFTCLSDSGEVLETDKWLWSQWRAVWVYSRIYNQMDPDPRWLKHAREIAAFCIRHGWDEAKGQWSLLLSREGRVLRGHESTYVDAFAVYGLLELYKATKDKEILRLLRRTADCALITLAAPYDQIPHFPYPIPAGAKPHGIPMLWSLKFAELGAALGDQRYLDAAGRLSDEIFRDFHRPDHNLILEIVHADGSDFPSPQGTVVVPGHVIEDMWFQIHVNELLGRPPERTAEAFRLALRHIELGWDELHGGGLLLAIDSTDSENVGWSFAETKLWWPHTEALYVMLLGWQRTGREEFLTWYRKIWDFCLAHYVDWENGEWRQKLGRDCKPLDTVVALPVKDPFHLPRSLILQWEVLTKPKV